MRPLDDAFWKKNWPPKDYNCKCRVRASRAEVTPAAELPDISNAKGLSGNSGLTGEVFTPEHPFVSNATKRGKKAIQTEFKQLFNARLSSWARENITGKLHQSKQGKVAVPEEAIEETLQAEHQHYYEKNLLIYDLPEALSQAEYHSETKDHIFLSITVQGNPTYLKLQKNDGNPVFVSVTEKPE